MTELPPLYGYVVFKQYSFFDSHISVIFANNAIEVYIEALDKGIVLEHIDMRDHD
jgi:hypothetical protein